MSKWRRLQKPALSFKGTMSESHCCVDCGFNTSPGNPTRAEAEQEAARQIRRGKRNWSIPQTVDSRCEIYCVHGHVWNASGMAAWGGCLCIGCLERRIGRELVPVDFDADHPFIVLPGTPRLPQRQGRYDPLGDFALPLVAAHVRSTQQNRP